MDISSDFIKLDSFLKLQSIVGSGGEAKSLILEGGVAVNGATEYRRGRKLYPGDNVQVHGKNLVVAGSSSDCQLKRS